MAYPRWGKNKHGERRKFDQDPKNDASDATRQRDRYWKKKLREVKKALSRLLP